MGNSNTRTKETAAPQEEIEEPDPNVVKAELLARKQARKQEYDRVHNVKAEFITGRISFDNILVNQQLYDKVHELNLGCRSFP